MHDTVSRLYCLTLLQAIKVSSYSRLFGSALFQHFRKSERERTIYDPFQREPITQPAEPDQIRSHKSLLVICSQEAT
ncbi:hypothetical protein HanRHA438_Chr04g0184461 [Helianthus annuus]|nr:hypothetical protein HanRHA438_Chr04g0184461 [Helianthus annuus]